MKNMNVVMQQDLREALTTNHRRDAYKNVIFLLGPEINYLNAISNRNAIKYNTFLT